MHQSSQRELVASMNRVTQLGALLASVARAMIPRAPKHWVLQAFASGGNRGKGLVKFINVATHLHAEPSPEETSRLTHRHAIRGTHQMFVRDGQVMKRKSIASLLFLLASLVWIPNAYAFVNWVWTYGANTYPTKAQAVAAMQAAGPGSSVLTQDAGITAMTSSEVQYKYVAPPQAITVNAWQYVNPSSGDGMPYLTSEADALSALLTYAEGWYGSCATVVANPTTDWTTSYPPAPPYGSLYDYKYYTLVFTFSGAPNCSSGTANYYTGLNRFRTTSCPAYYQISNTAPYCQDTSFDYIETVPCPCAASAAPGNSPLVGNPCDVSTADKSQTETDYAGAGLSFIRYYHSATLEASHTLGVGWTHNFAAYLILYEGQPEGLERPDGHHDPLSAVGSGYVSQSGASIHVQQSGSNWIAYLGDGSQEVYNASGALIQMINPAGQVSTLNYNADGTLASVVGQFGHTLQFAYTNGLMTQFTDPAGNNIAYSYDGNNNLILVTYQDSTTRAYEYELSTFPNHLTGITDESANRFATFGYDSIGRAVSSQHAGGADAIGITYGSSQATVTDAISGTTVFNFTNQASYSQRVTSVSHNGLTRNYVVPDPSVDVQQRVTQFTDENGNISTYAYDADHMTSTTEASSTSIARTSSYQYLATNTALPTLVTEALRQTSYTYYSGTNNVETKTVTDTTVTPNVSRTWTYAYDSYGRVLTAQGPRTDINSTTTYSYYTCTSGAQCGQVHTITDPVGNVTTYNTYNAHGQPLTITDPNGVVTTMTYDARLRMTSRQVGTETTGFAYYPTGLLQTVTLPDGSTLQYTYDAAHRLTKMADGAGNSIQYTLDAMGNRIAESAYDPSNALSRTHSRVYNSLNQLYEDIGAAGSIAVTTTYGYDNAGNQTTINAPLSRNTTQTYDALNRLQQITDPGDGNTHFSYDANNNLTAVQDPAGRTTQYTLSGLGDTLQLVSPATGTTTNTYDSGGNLAASLDARGKTASYSYDALNRVTQVAYGDQTIAYSYDTGTYGKGRLTGASDSNHSLTWLYDALGRVNQKTQTVAGVTKSVSYAYTNGDLTTLTTPSGQSVVYTYSNHHVASITVNGITLLSNVAYEPFGPSRGWSWGNGTAEIRLYDTDGNPSQFTGPESTSYTLDTAFRITGISNASNVTLSWIYSYDKLDRLTSANSSNTVLNWTYDGDGNRLSQGGGQNITASASSLVYNNRGRLITATTSIGAAGSVYSALGQRIEKINSQNSFLYFYDENGHLLGEYTSAGALIQETVWLGDTPVATLQPGSGSAINVYYIHSDHLNTPKTITRSSDNAIVWRWDQDPFGTAAPNQNPSGIGTFSYNPRFPGQYFDSETGLNYNYARDYDPSTGRFIESDPLGLYGSAHTYDLIRDYDPQTDQYVQANPLGASGAVNTYRYVRDNPLEYVDPTGKFEVLAFIVPVVAVGGGLACYIHGLHQCEKLYPNHRDPLSPDYVRFIKCSTGVASVIGRGMGLSSDPLGGGVGAAGEAAGEASSK